MANGSDTTGVIGILGTSFSGSTVLNLMLGAHPAIYAGGELSALILSRGQAGVADCSACGFSCRYWDERARSAVTTANLYREVQKIFGRKWIVDSSKSIDWFNDVLRSEEHRRVTATYVLMVKHPIRYLASCIANIAADKPRGRTRGIFTTLSASRSRAAFLDELAADLNRFYEQFFWCFGKSVGGATFHLMHYERLIDDPAGSLAPLLCSLGLSYVPEMADFFRKEYHQIGGNAGPIYQLGHGWPKGADIAPARKSFYEQGAALRIDNKYRELLSAPEIARLRAHPVVRQLCDRLGYDRPDMPFPLD
jgi:sulfotransferase family protein